MQNLVLPITNNELRITRAKPCTRRYVAKRGFSILEIILAMGLFAIIISGAVGVVIQAFSSTRLGEEVTKATFLATEGLEAARAIQERDFWSLVGTGLDETYGLDKATGIWKFSGTQNTFGKYTRKIVIYNVYRDGNGNIVEGGEFLDLYTKRVEAVVTWDFGPTRHNTVSLPTYFTYWESALCVWDTGQVIATLNLDGDGDGTAVQVVEDRAYVTTMKNPATSGEFFVLDISEPSSLSSEDILGKLRIDDHVNDLAVSGNYAYLATSKSGEEFIIVDISDPTNPKKAAFYDVPGTSQAFDISVEGGYAYVVTPKSTDGPELHVFNIAKPLEPERVGGGFEVNSHVYGVKATKDKQVYLATSRVDKELIIVDVSDPQNLGSDDERGSYDAPSTGANGQAVDVIRGGIAYLVTRNNTGDIPEFYLLAIADPENISLVGSFNVGGRANGVAAGVGFALLATETDDEEFMILNLKDPSNPEKVFYRNLNGAAGGVALLEDECIAFYVTAKDDAEFQVVQPVVQP